MIRAHAFTAMGKLCLRDLQLAKKCITLLVRELESGSCAVVRNNALAVMFDLARTFTAVRRAGAAPPHVTALTPRAQVVDQYVEPLTSCLIDKSPLIRRHALMVVSQLLQEDYIKCKVRAGVCVHTELQPRPLSRRGRGPCSTGCCAAWSTKTRASGAWPCSRSPTSSTRRCRTRCGCIVPV